jgi:DNA invertase Pin-like site-specific DNA recombinase
MRIRKKSDKPTLAQLYARVSTEEQAEKGLSLPAQIEELRRYCRERGIAIFREYIEPGVSGTDDNRREFRRMIKDALEPSSKVDAILVLTTSRFMRNVDMARLRKAELRSQGIRVIAIKQETADDAPGHFAEGMFELFDQYESEVNGMRTAAALREAARQGYFPHPYSPFGFRLEKVDVGGARTRNRLVPNLDEVSIHNEVFRTYVHVGGAKASAQDLNRRELRYRGRRFRKEDVLRIIDEHAAVGAYIWNQYDSKTDELLPEDEWIRIPCKPIIDRELYDLAQKIRAERDPKKTIGRTGSSPLLLAGLIFCGKCGASCQLETSGKVSPNGRGYRYYNCRSFCRTGRDKCRGFRIPTDELDRAVVNHLADQLFTDERCKVILQDILEETGLLRHKSNERLRQMQVELESVEKKLRRWEDAFETGALPADLGIERLVELRAQRDDLRQTLAKVVPIVPPPPHLFAEATVKRFQENVRSIFVSGDNALTRHYLRFLVARVEVTDAHVRVLGRTEAVAQLLAQKQPSSPKLPPAGEVLATVSAWLRDRAASARFGEQTDRERANAREPSETRGAQS